MTHHLTKPIRAIHFMVLAFLMMIGSQATSQAMKTGDVIYCTSDVGAFAQASDNFKLSSWLNHSFKFQITKDSGGKQIIKFGSGGYFNGSTMKVDYFLEGSPLLEASSVSSKFYLLDGRFNFGTVTGSQAGFFSGTCDKF